MQPPVPPSSDPADRTDEPGRIPLAGASDPADYEATPLTRQEYISAMVHLYRGELHRANAWRLRLDHTTNLAVLTTAGLIAYSFGQSDHKHWVLIGAVALVCFFHLIEARRFRFADVWRARVRMIEENFYGPVLRRDPVGERNDWGQLVAEDLFQPRFKMSALAAVRQRLVRNYWAIYLVTITAWTVKILFVPTPVTQWTQIQEKLGGDGIVPWWSPLGIVGAFVACALLLAAFGPRVTTYDLDQWRFIEDAPAPRNPDVDM